MWTPPSIRLDTFQQATIFQVIPFIHPRLRKSDHGAQTIRRLEGMMPMISEEDVNTLVTAEWKVYQTGDFDSTTQRDYH